MNPKPPFSLSLLFSNLIFRNIYKVIYKACHSKTYKHNRRYWPYYDVERNQHGGISKIFFKKKLIINHSNITLPDLKKCIDRKSTRLNSSHVKKSYSVFCLKKK